MLVKRVAPLCRLYVHLENIHLMHWRTELGAEYALQENTLLVVLRALVCSPLLVDMHQILMDWGLIFKHLLLPNVQLANIQQ